LSTTENHTQKEKTKNNIFSQEFVDWKLPPLHACTTIPKEKSIKFHQREETQLGQTQNSKHPMCLLTGDIQIYLYSNFCT